MRNGGPLLLLVLLVLLAGCSSRTPVGDGGDGAPQRRLDPAAIADAVPRAEPRSRYGNPSSYVVRGKRYYTKSSAAGYTERGIASWYGTKFHGRRTSSGEPYDMYAMTAAHKTLPLPTYVRVKNLRNGRSAVVKVNDRGPFHDNRIIDLSYAAATKLGILGQGTGLVEVTAIDPRRPNQAVAPVPPPATAVAAVTPGSAPVMYIQVGAFSSRGNADRLRQRLQGEIEQPVRVEQGTGSGGVPLFRVQVGPLADVDGTDRVASRLLSIGFDRQHIVIK